MTNATKKKNDGKAQPRDIFRYFTRVAFSFPFMAWGSIILAPSTIIIERYISPLIIASILVDIQHQTINLHNSLWLIVAYGLIQIYAQVVGYRFNLFMMWTVQVKGSRKIYDEAYEKLSQHSLNFFNDRFVGSLVSQTNKITGAYMQFWNLVTYKILFIGTSIVATLVGLSFLVWQYAIVIFVLIIVFVITVIYGMRFIRPRFKARAEAYSRISGDLSDSVSNILAVKVDGREDHELHRFRSSTSHMLKTELHARNGFVAVSAGYAFIIGFMRIGALVASIAAIEYGFGNAGVVYLCLTYTFNLIEEIWSFNDIVRDYYEIVSNSEEMYGVMQEDQGVKDHSSKSLTITQGTISLNNVSFSHKDGKDSLFSDFNLTIPAGQKLGVVGVSGSGKTTLTKLLLRFMDVDKGEILVDEQNISKVSQKSLRQAVAYVPQEPLLFHRSLSENISYSRDDADTKAIELAAKKAHASEFIESLPDGFDTLVGERGVKLSGGQRQRIAIARAILKDAPLLVLDEATSALDSESETLIQKAIQNLWKDKTAIVIAHRLSTIAKLDRIIVLEKGKIVEDGSHKELLAKNGVYANLWKHQSGGFLEE